MHRSVLVSALAWLAGCAHAPAPACPKPESPPSGSAVSSPPPALGFADPAALAEAEPLALYDLRWTLLAGDSGAIAEVPSTPHSFTLGRWECALSAEQASDAFESGHARVRRERRVACTHQTGLTMQTELRCGFDMPARPAEGSPRLARRETHIALGDAPAFTLACEPFATDRLSLMQGAHEPLADVCLVQGAVGACQP